jgi:hypothetical protein
MGIVMNSNQKNLNLKQERKVNNKKLTIKIRLREN